MLILPPGHYQEISGKRRRNGRERWLVGIGALLAAVIVAITLFSLTTKRGTNGNGCLNFTYAMVMGGEEFHACGAEAVRFCTKPPNPGGLGADFTHRLKLACQDAKIGTLRPS